MYALKYEKISPAAAISECFCPHMLIKVEKILPAALFYTKNRPIFLATIVPPPEIFLYTPMCVSAMHNNENSERNMEQCAIARICPGWNFERAHLCYLYALLLVLGLSTSLIGQFVFIAVH